MKIVSVAEMRSIEEEANLKGLPFSQMMENAGNNIATLISDLSFPSDQRKILGLVGPGNNGGDTLIALSKLISNGWQAHAYIIHRKIDNDSLITGFEEIGGKIFLAENDTDFHHLKTILGGTKVILDGILGIGIKLPLDEIITIILGNIKRSLQQMPNPPLIIGVDCPSGVNCDTGEVGGQVLPVNITITMAAIKQGLLMFPANDFVGTINVAGIGDLSKLHSWKKISHTLADETVVQEIIPKRMRNSHKGTYGTVVIVAGSVNYTGAAILAGSAAARTGVGLVTMAVPSILHPVLAGNFPEATWILLPHEMGVIAESAAEVISQNIDHASAILIGPGIGTQGTTVECITKLLKDQPKNNWINRRIGFIHSEANNNENHLSRRLAPLVFDADGLRILSKIPNWVDILPPNSILTPHPGEMSALTSLSIDEIQADRANIARKYSVQWGHVVVLKGAYTIIASPDGRSTVIPFASSALAHAGSGDVLAGIITGYRAQGLPPYESAFLGAWIHAQAGVYAAESAQNTASVLARDIINFIGKVISKYDK